MEKNATKIYAAIVQHNRWKVRLKETLESRVIWEGYDPHPDHCEFGRWLAENAGEFFTDDHYRTVSELHRQFHQSAETVVNLIQTNRKSEAETALNYGGDFDCASQALIKAVIAWHDKLTGK